MKMVLQTESEIDAVIRKIINGNLGISQEISAGLQTEAWRFWKESNDDVMRHMHESGAFDVCRFNEAFECIKSPESPDEDGGIVGISSWSALHCVDFPERDFDEMLHDTSTVDVEAVTAARDNDVQAKADPDGAMSSRARELAEQRAASGAAEAARYAEYYPGGRAHQPGVTISWEEYCMLD